MRYKRIANGYSIISGILKENQANSWPTCLSFARLHAACSHCATVDSFKMLFSSNYSRFTLSVICFHSFCINSFSTVTLNRSQRFSNTLFLNHADAKSYINSHCWLFWQSSYTREQCRCVSYNRRRPLFSQLRQC